MKYTIVYVDDDLNPHAYGNFTDREAAEKRADKMDEDLDKDRDIAGGGQGHVRVCQIQPLRNWV